MIQNIKNGKSNQYSPFGILILCQVLSCDGSFYASLTGPWSAHTFGQTLFWECLWGCFLMRLTFTSVDRVKQMLSITWVCIIQSDEGELDQRLTLPWVRQFFVVDWVWTGALAFLPPWDLRWDKSWISSMLAFQWISLVSGLKTGTGATHSALLGLWLVESPGRSQGLASYNIMLANLL